MPATNVENQLRLTNTELNKQIALLEKARKELSVIKQSADEASEFSESVIKTIREPLIALDHDLRVVAASRSFYDVFKVKPEETVGQLIYDLGNKQWDIIKLRDLLETILPRKTSFDNYEVEHDFASIGRRVMLLNARQIQRALGREKIILLAIEDITERRQLETLLEDSEKRYRRLFETANDGILLLEKREGLIAQANPAVTTMLGYSNEEFIGNSLKNIGFPDDVGTIQEILQTLEKDGILHYKDAPLQNKNTNVINADIYMVDKASLIQCNIRDATERNRVEKVLRERELFITTMLESLPIPVFYKNREGEYLGCNRSFERFYKRNRIDIIGKSVYDMGTEEIAEKYNRMDMELFDNPGIQSYGWKVLNGAGELRDVIFYKSTFEDGDGKVVGLIGGILDITEQKRAEESLRLSEEKFRKAVLTSPDAIVITRLADGEFVLANQGFYELSGYTEKEVIGKTSLDRLNIWADPEERGKIIQKLSVKGSVKNFEARFLKKNGDVISGLMSASIIDLNGSQHILTITRDITDQKQAQEETAILQTQLQQAQKMEAIGTLAGGIAHDFNNILSAILGYTELAIADVPEGSNGMDNLEEVLKAGNRAKDLVGQILAFSRQTETQFFQIQIHLIIKEALKLLRASLPSTIEINENIRAFGKVLADPTQIHQIMMNLCTNASHAMTEDGGELSVSLLQVKAIDEPFVPRNLSPGPYLKLTVSDTGCGMMPDVISRIFEPYFTTKGIGKGTGLGLSMVQGIVESHGGVVTVDSIPGKGTRFHVYLPEIIDPVNDTETIKKEETVFQGTERILVVDDEPTIIKMLKKVLERSGYEVTGRTGSIEALELFKAKPDQFDLILTDMTMPYMTGYQLARQLIEIRSDIPIILCTGFHEKVSEEATKEIGIRAVVMKPILQNVLAQTIRKVLDGEE